MIVDYNFKKRWTAKARLRVVERKDTCKSGIRNGNLYFACFNILWENGGRLRKILTRITEK
jgi:hypothetical protein